jgi:hypothetical protein
MLPRQSIAVAVLVLLVSFMPQVVRAQVFSVSHDVRDIAAWASVGLGSTSRGVAGQVRETISAGPLLVMLRQSDDGPFISAGAGVKNHDILVGVRSGGHRLFASAALGYGSAEWYHQGDQCTCYTTRHAVAVATYDVTLHANAFVPGLSAGFSGNLGARDVSYSAFMLSLELGWFGRAPSAARSSRF